MKSPFDVGEYPLKLFYKIGEVSRIVGVESYVLRYWEEEFSFLRPQKSKAGQRVYTQREIDLILRIKRLLYEEKYTIDGVRKRLKGEKEPGKTGLAGDEDRISINRLNSLVRERLREILKSLT